MINHGDQMMPRKGNGASYKADQTLLVSHIFRMINESCVDSLRHLILSISVSYLIDTTFLKMQGNVFWRMKDGGHLVSLTSHHVHTTRVSLLQIVSLSW